MRTTMGMISNRYTKNLSTGLSNLDYYSNRATTFRKFEKVSEDPVAAIKAFRLRREYSQNEDYKLNIKDTENLYTTAESSIMAINNMTQECMTQDCLKGITGTSGPDERKIIAKKLREVQASIVSTSNAKFADQFIFGGTDKTQPPFQVTADGELTYRGVNVNTGKNEFGDVNMDNLANEKVFIDLGLGMKINEDGSTENEQTMFNTAIPGISFLGHGVDEEGLPNNVYSIMGKIADQLESPDYSFDETVKLVTKFQEGSMVVLKKVTEMGTKADFLKYTEKRIDDSEYNLNVKLQQIEQLDPAKAIMDLKMQDFAYNAALQMGMKILRNTFLDFMN